MSVLSTKTNKKKHETVNFHSFMLLKTIVLWSLLPDMSCPNKLKIYSSDVKILNPALSKSSLHSWIDVL